MSLKRGRFGRFGGQYVPDTLFSALTGLEQAYRDVRKDDSFQQDLNQLLSDYVGRPTPLYFAQRLSEQLACQVYLKREDLCHTGAHKINNALGQVLLAKKMNKQRIIAETGAGQHGVATATACALMGLDCCIYMGAKDVQRQALNVSRMKLLGAQVVSVEMGSQTLKDATSEAIRDWLKSVETTHYIIGSVVGPHPFPTMVRDFQAVIGREARAQLLKKTERLPDCVVACVGGGSNAMGIFFPFIEDESVRLVAVEAAGKGLDCPGAHSAALKKGRPGVLHGSYSYLLQTETGQIDDVHSISAGLDYPGVGPELSYLKDLGRVEVAAVTDEEAMQGCFWLAQQEGIIPALETAHALAYIKSSGAVKKDDVVIVNVSGRGDKDLETIVAHF